MIRRDRESAILIILLILALITLMSGVGSAQIAITTNDGNVRISDGQISFDPNGPNSISIIDTSTMPPKVTQLDGIVNSIFGPPTNVAVTPDETLALVTEAVRIEQPAGADKPEVVKGESVSIIDLKSDPPHKIGSVKVGSQPSGVSITPDGRLALVCNRAGNSISVLRIEGTEVTNIGEVDMGQSVTHVAITPDGRRGVVTKFMDHAVSLIDIDGENVTYAGRDLPVGLYPYNVVITPDGALALVANTGNKGRSDGNVDSVSVVDLSADPPRVIDHLAVGDGAEGIAVDPLGRWAVVPLLNGNDGPHDAFFHNPTGVAAILRIQGKRVTKVGEITVGRLPEGIAFTPDGRYCLIANLMDNNVSVLEVSDTSISGPVLTFPVGIGPGGMGAAPVRPR